MPNQEIAALTAKDIMTKRVVKVDREVPVMEAIRKLYVTNVGALVVIDENEEIAGIFTERDILRRVIPKKIKMDKVPVAEVMTASPVTATPQTPIIKVYETMSRMNFRHIPVIDGKTIVGIISIKDIAKACMKFA